MIWRFCVGGFAGGLSGGFWSLISERLAGSVVVSFRVFLK